MDSGVDPDPGEEFVECLNLFVQDPSVDPSRLYIFRRSGSSGNYNALRLVTWRSYTDANNIHKTKEETITMNLLKYVLIPRYAFPSSANSTQTWWVELGDPDTVQKARGFRSEADVLRFQRACTKYDVVVNKGNVKCCVAYRKAGSVNPFRSTSLSIGEGNLHLWESMIKANSDTSSFLQSVREDQSFQTESEAPSRPSTISSSFETRTVRLLRTTTSTYIAWPSELPPMLVLFFISENKGEDVYTMWKVDVSRLTIKPADLDFPTELVLEKSSSSDILVWTISDAGKNSIKSCNMLALIHQRHKDRSRVKEYSLQYLSLHFERTQDREECRTHLERVMFDRARYENALRTGTILATRIVNTMATPRTQHTSSTSSGPPRTHSFGTTRTATTATTETTTTPEVNGSESPEVVDHDDIHSIPASSDHLSDFPRSQRDYNAYKQSDYGSIA